MGEPMSKKLDWRRAKLHSKPSLDHRWEFTEFNRDRADRWLQAVERRLLQEQRTARTTMTSSVVAGRAMSDGSGDL